MEFALFPQILRYYCDVVCKCSLDQQQNGMSLKVKHNTFWFI